MWRGARQTWGGAAGGAGSGQRIRRKSHKVLNMKTLNPAVPQVQYAVRGPVLLLADSITQQLQQGKVKFPFKSVVKANIGDAQAAGQPYLTFYRQVMACVAYPPLLNNRDMPEDVKNRASRILDECSGASYSPSAGLEVVRKDVAAYMQLRDGLPSSADNIVITTGASAAIRFCFQLYHNVHKLGKGRKPAGIMTPVPLYPIFSALLSEYQLTSVRYFLDEDQLWRVSPEELQRAYDGAKGSCDVRAIVIINPGNPTGQIFSKQIIHDIIKFAHKHKLFIISDEVYQDNVFAAGVDFYSVKQGLKELGPPYSGVEVATLLTISKGYSGEAGARTGWMELNNVRPAVRQSLLRIIDSHRCPSILGQSMVDAAVAPPKPKEPSHTLFMKEKTAVLSSLKERTEFLVKGLNSIKGYHSNPIQGSLYAFPRVTLPPRAVSDAKTHGREPDTHYAFKMLEQQGICVVPGSGFGQSPGTHHYRMSVLPPLDTLREAVQKIQKFHTQFLKEYS